MIRGKGKEKGRGERERRQGKEKGKGEREKRKEKGKEKGDMIFLWETTTVDCAISRLPLHPKVNCAIFSAQLQLECVCVRAYDLESRLNCPVSVSFSG